MNTLMLITNFMIRSLSNNSNPTRSHSRKVNIILSLLFIITGLLIYSCEEDPTSIGKDLLPAGDFAAIEGTDTISSFSFTMYDERVNTSLPLIGYLGKIADPYFGTTTASFVTQLRLKEEWPGDSIEIDSMKLFLEFNTVQGAPEGLHTLNFSEIAEEIYADSAYYSNTDIALTGSSWTLPLPPLRTDTINNIEIKFTDFDFAERLLSDTSRLFHSNSVPDFRSYFKGLHFTIESAGDPVLASVNLANDGTPGRIIFDRYYKNYFVIYYHDNDGNLDSYYFMIDATNRNASFNKFNHDFSTADPDKMVENFNNLSVRDTLTYLQSLNGLYTRIMLPGLADLKNSGEFDSIAVNKARLTIPYYYDDDLYKPGNVPVQLLMRYRTESGLKPVVHDVGIDEFREFYDGMRDTINHVYNFNLATFVQRYLEDASGDILPELEVIQGSGTSNLILKANESSTPVLFDFIYTRF